MSFYIIKGKTGGLVVSNQEPEIERMVAGPFIDHLDAFERMETLEKRSLFRRAAFAVVWPIAVVIAVATLIE